MLLKIGPYCIIALIMLWAICAELNYRDRVERNDEEWRIKVHERKIETK